MAADEFFEPTRCLRRAGSSANIFVTHRPGGESCSSLCHDESVLADGDRIARRIFPTAAQLKRI
jgi:hypothetical protein